MWKSYLRAAVMFGSLLIGTVAAAEQASSSVTEIGGPLQVWNPAAGYLVVNDTRLRVDGDVSVISDTGAPLSTKALRDGVDVLVSESGGVVNQITVLSGSERSLPN